ncbi:MAG: OB-fold protein [Polaribacter sp.]|uniref:OB-fold protein n=1 Tax=Polaribacter sp. TaxID=1920175 RepID=UPI00384FF3E0
MTAKKIIFGILLLFCLGAIIGYKIYNKPHVNVAQEKAAISDTASVILEAFSADEAAANLKYLGKIIEVKGVISKIEVVNKKGSITLETNALFGSVLCTLTPEESLYIKELKIGQEVLLKGICTGFLMDVILVKCIIQN